MAIRNKSVNPERFQLTEPLTLVEMHGLIDRWAIVRVLREARGNQSVAARKLDISRSSLRHKMREFGITISVAADAAD